MEYIRTKDNVWHNCDNEMPPTTTNVYFMDKEGDIHEGEIVVDLGGFYVYLGRYKGWGSFNDMVKWKFR